jgi:uncharacterized protein (DUF1684 family)
MRHRRPVIASIASIAPIAPVAAGLLAVGGVACSSREPLVSHASSTDDLAAATDAWHAERVAALTAPDGWLSLVTLAWLEPGANRVGRDPAAAVAYAGLPADHVGTLHVDGDGGGIRFEPAAGVAVTGVPDDGMLRTDADGPPTVVQVGRCRFEVIVRGGRPAVRMRDPEADSRVGFNGIERFPVDPAWSIEAAFEPAAGGEEVAVDSVIGVVDQTAVAGRARFEQGGRAVDLVLHPGGAEDRYFLVFGDATNGRETSGGGRFLLVERSGPGTVRLDFNRAYNPPCSFTDFATCPLPVPGNRLPFAVTAGERRYQRP